MISSDQIAVVHELLADIGQALDDNPPNPTDLNDLLLLLRVIRQELNDHSAKCYRLRQSSGEW